MPLDIFQLRGMCHAQFVARPARHSAVKVEWMGTARTDSAENGVCFLLLTTAAIPEVDACVQ